MRRRFLVIGASIGAASAVLMLLAHRCSTASIFQASLAFMLCCIAAHDAKTRRIENVTVLTVAGLRLYEITLGAIAGGTGLAPALSYSLVGAAAVLAVLLATAMIMERGTGSAGIGGGDVKLLFVAGTYFGWMQGIFLVVTACVLGLVFAVLGRGKREGEDAGMIPFGPSIAAACWITALVGDAVVKWYTGLFM